MKLSLAKKNFGLYFVLVSLAGVCAWNVGAALKWERENGRPVAPEKMVDMGLRLAFYPDEIKEHYNKYLMDDVLSDREFQQVGELMSQYDRRIDTLVAEREKSANSRENMTRLQFAEANLKAFEEYGHMIMTEAEFQKVREIMKNKITQEQLYEKNRKKSETL